MTSTAVRKPAEASRWLDAMGSAVATERLRSVRGGGVPSSRCGPRGSADRPRNGRAAGQMTARRPGFRVTSELLQPDLVLVVVLRDEAVVRPVRQAIRHHQTGVLLLGVRDLLVEVVLGRVRALNLVVRLQEAPVQLVRRLDDLDAGGEHVQAGLRRLLLEADEGVPGAPLH